MTLRFRISSIVSSMSAAFPLLVGLALTSTLAGCGRAESTAQATKVSLDSAPALAVTLVPARS